MFKLIVESILFFGYLLVSPYLIWRLELGPVAWFVYATFWALLSYASLMNGHRNMKLDAVLAAIDRVEKRK